jgi:hypothetical protein
VTRTADLEARRRALLARCEAQRAELSHRIARLRLQSPRGAAGEALPGVGDRAYLSRHPLAWVVAVGAVLLLGSTREVLSVLGWARTALALASRAAQLMRLVRHARATGGGP